MGKPVISGHVSNKPEISVSKISHFSLPFSASAADRGFGKSRNNSCLFDNILNFGYNGHVSENHRACPVDERAY